MKILHVVHGYPPEVVGGTERYVEALVKALIREGHELRVVAGSLKYTGRTETEQLRQDGVDVVRLRRGDLYFDSWDKAFNPHVERLFREQIEVFRPDLVHLHHWIRLTASLARTAVRLGVPVLATLHDLYLTCPRVFRVRDQQLLCERELGPASCLECVPRWRFQSDDEIATSLGAYVQDVAGEAAVLSAAITPSRIHAAGLDRYQPAVRGRIEVIPHPSLSNLRPSRRSPPGAMPRVACWSHLHPLKGQHLLLQALTRIEEGASIPIDLYGDAFLDDYRDRLDGLARGLDVTFHGAYRPEDLCERTIDIVVIPTMARESYSFILDEAAALGAPILAADAGALRERATPRVVFFRRGDPADLADKLLELVNDEPRRRRMEAAPSPPTSSLADHLERLGRLYRDVVRNGAMPSPEDDHRDRLEREWDRRELGFRELVRAERWEEAIADLQGANESLRRRLESLERAARSASRGRPGPGSGGGPGSAGGAP